LGTFLFLLFCNLTGEAMPKLARLVFVSAVVIVAVFALGDDEDHVSEVADLSPLGEGRRGKASTVRRGVLQTVGAFSFGGGGSFQGNFEEMGSELGEAVDRFEQGVLLGEAKLSAQGRKSVKKFILDTVQKTRPAHATAWKHGASAPDVCGECSAACEAKKHPICDLPYSPTAYDKNPPRGRVTCPRERHGKVVGRKTKCSNHYNNCRYQITVKGMQIFAEKNFRNIDRSITDRNEQTCTACKDGFVLEVKFNRARAGQCWRYSEKARVHCAALDENVSIARPSDHKQICTKHVLATELFHAKSLKRGSAEYRHFESAQGVDGWAVARCQVAKYTSCRDGTCAVKKTIKCHSVCKTVLRKGKAWYIAQNNPDCGEKGKRLCKTYGAMACSQAAMMT